LSDDADGGILTFYAEDTKWSYVKLNEQGYACEVAEKKVISHEASCGIYYWKKGSEYVRLAEEMIANNIRVNNEFYVCPVYNQLFAINGKVKVYRANNMHGLGTPEDYQHYLNKCGQ
jgi:hypothetical protein